MIQLRVALLAASVAVTGCQGSGAVSGAHATTAPEQPPSSASRPPNAPTVVPALPGSSNIPVSSPAEFIFAVPPGWVVSADSSPASAHLVRAGLGNPESIVMDGGPGSTFTAQQAIGTVQVGGETGKVIADGPSHSAAPGYQRIIQVLHLGRLFEVRCLGYSGFDRTALLRGCDSFLDSVRWR